MHRRLHLLRPADAPSGQTKAVVLSQRTAQHLGAPDPRAADLPTGPCGDAAGCGVPCPDHTPRPPGPAPTLPECAVCPRPPRPATVVSALFLSSGQGPKEPKLGSACPWALLPSWPLRNAAGQRQAGVLALQVQVQGESRWPWRQVQAPAPCPGLALRIHPPSIHPSTYYPHTLLPSTHSPIPPTPTASTHELALF